ncbi:MAG: hypothetical protein CVU78_05615 [Elusimicrobia bacterium HGW-Elusimicrobia-2]|nr:MAG: hypothetical protein CVU78_05615 [Elusimicrobia bacterium HGW-Elusimicrobia-2]
MAEGKKPPFTFGGAKPPSFGGAKPPSFAGAKKPDGRDTPQSPSGGFPQSPAPLKQESDTVAPEIGGQNYTNQLRSKIEQAKKTLEESLTRKKEKLEARELYWMSTLKEKEQEAEKIKQEMKAALDRMEMSQAEKEVSLRSALEQFEGRLMSVSRELEDEKKKSYRSMQKAREESEASLKVEMALKEIVSSKDYEDKLQNMQAARENLLKDMIRQKDNFNREKSALEEQIGALNEQVYRQREVIARQESSEKIFETQKEKEIGAARQDAKSRLEDLVNQVKSREDGVRIKENEFRIQELANRQKLDNISDDLKRKEAELTALRDLASRLERELHAARQALEEGNSKFVKEIDWLKKHFEEERASWADRFAQESRMRKETASSHTDIVRDRDSVLRELAAARAGEKDLSGHLAEREKEIADLKNSFEKEKNEVKNIYESGLRNITAARDELARELEGYADAERRFAEEKNKFTGDLAFAQKRLREKEGDERDLAQKIKDISAQKLALEQRAEDDRRAFEDAKQKLYSRITQLNSEKENLSGEKSAAAGRIQQLAGEISRQEQELGALQAEYRAKAGDYSREKGILETKIKNLEDEKAAQERKTAEYVSQCDALKEKLKKQSETAGKASAELIEAKEVIGNLNTRLSESEKELSVFLEREKQLREKITNYEREIGQLNKNIASLKEESAKGSALKDSELEKARSEIGGLNARLDGFIEEKNKLSEKYKAISEELFEMTKQRDTLFNEKNALAEELSASQKQLEKLLAEASGQAVQIAASGGEISLLNDKLKALSTARQAETVELKNKILEQHKKMEELFSRINEYNVEIEKLKAEPRESVEEYKRQLLDREKANEQMRSQLEALRSEKESAADKDGIIKEYDGKIAGLEAELAETGAEIEKMRESAVRASDLDSEIVRKDAQLKEASVELKELRSRIESLEEEKLRSREKFDAELSAIKEEYERSRQDVEEGIEAFEKTKSELEELKAKITGLAEENASLLIAKEDAAAASEKLRDLTEKQEREIEGLKEHLTMTVDETAAAYDEKIKKLSAEANENREKAAGFEGSLREAEKEIARLKEASVSENRQTDEFNEKLKELGDIIEKQKKDISGKMEYIKDKELEFHKILKKKNEDISVLKAQLELGLEALDSKSAAPNDKRLAELQRINEEIGRKSAQREAMLREEIERKEKEAAEYRNQIRAAESPQPSDHPVVPPELEDEIKSRTAEALRLKSEMERARKYYERLESIIKKQDEKITQLQKKDGGGSIIKKHDIIPDDDGDIKF